VKSWLPTVVASEVDIIIPAWIKVSSDYDPSIRLSLENQLDPGEASAIARCLQLPQSKLIIDERKGRRIAREHGLEIIGLLGIIVMAKQRGKIEHGLTLIDELTANGFRLSEKLRAIVKDRLGE